ncbi:MAG: hypothetical protein ACOYI4_01075 [Christensenellales bacterium]|jgi:hypothetical protein
MRYDTPIYFQRIAPGAYDPATGDYADDDVSETKAYASITDTKEETMRLVYGEIKQGSLTVRLQNRYEEPFDYIRIGETRRYTVDFRRRLRVKDVFFVSEVQ